MNILIGKIGKSTLFSPGKWGTIGGDEVTSIFYKLLARKYPQHNFYMIGKSDLGKKIKKLDTTHYVDNPDDIPSNIYNLWEGFDKSIDTNYTYLYKSSKGVKFDFGLLFVGMNSNVNIPGKIYKMTDKNNFSKPLDTFVNYAGPIIDFFNQTGINLVLLNEDPRYIPLNSRDLFNVEKFTLTQMEENVISKRIISYEDQAIVQHNVPHHYGMIETIFFANRKKLPKPSKLDLIKKSGFYMALHTGDGRFNIVEDWLIKKDPNIVINGKWKEEELAQYPNSFKDVALIDDIQNVYNNRYTLILSRSKRWPQFVTQKFWEMADLGLIPFIHKDYDSKKILPIDDYLRVSSPDEMWGRIDDLNSNDELYEALYDYIFEDILRDDLYTGEVVIEKLNERLEQYFGYRL